MLALPLGPLSLPVPPLLLLAAVWAASMLAARLAGPAAAKPASDALWHAAAAGLLAARAMHLALNADAYLQQPLSALDLRDGGWNAAAGVLGALAWLGWRVWPRPALRQPVAFAAAAGVALWASAVAWLEELQPQELPALPLAALDGATTVDLKDLAPGRPLVLNLWATWCAPCRAEMPVLAAAQQRGGKARIVFVNQGEAPDTVRRFLAAQGLPLQDHWLDATSRLGPAVRSPGLPTTLFYDARGRLVGAHVGVLNAPALEGRLRALAASAP